MEYEERIKEIIPTQRTEEVTDIIDRMPTTFAKRIALLVCFIVGLLLFFGFIVEYPDVVAGEVSISAEQAPLQLVAEYTGKLKINGIESHDSVVSGQLLAWIDNPARPEWVLQIAGFLEHVSLPTSNARLLYDRIPKHLNLGDLTIPYSSFLSSVKQLADYQDHHLYDKQERSLEKILAEQRQALQTLIEKEDLSVQHLKLVSKFLKRDSILLSRKIISPAEYEQSVVRMIGAVDQVKSSARNSGSVREQISNTENAIQQNRIISSEKEMQLDLELLTSFNNVVDKINLWKKQYLITSPIPGRVQFLKFWNENQFVQAGEPIFSIVPQENHILGKGCTTGKWGWKSGSGARSDR